jgi:hypothetical protein
VLHYAFESSVRLFQSGESFVEPIADIVMYIIEEVVPTSLLGDEE